MDFIKHLIAFVLGIVSFGGGNGTIDQLQLFKATTTPYNAITTNVYQKNLYLPGSWATSTGMVADKFCLTGDSCISSWPSAAGGTPAGSNGQVQYKSGSNFAGTATTSVTCSGDTSCSSFTVIGSSPITISSTAGAAGSGFSTTSQNYWESQLGSWKVVNGYLTPTTSIGVIFPASSTFSGGLLTINGGASTTNLTASGIVYGSAGTVTLPGFYIPTAGGIYKRNTNEIGLTNGVSSVGWDGTSLVPGTTDARDLGSIGNRWDEIFGSFIRVTRAGGTATTTIFNDSTDHLVIKSSTTTKDLTQLSVIAPDTLPLEADIVAIITPPEGGTRAFEFDNQDNARRQVNLTESISGAATFSPWMFQMCASGNCVPGYSFDPSGAQAIGVTASTLLDKNALLQLASSTAPRLFEVDGTRNDHKFTVFQDGVTLNVSSTTITGLKSCDTIDTDATGKLTCGTDATAAGAFATSSADYWLTQRNFFSTTSADWWGSTKGYLTTVDISANTNLAATYPIILTNDTLSFPATSTQYGSGTAGQVLMWSGITGAPVWAATSSSGGGTWGSITGTLSSQVDLDAAFKTKIGTSSNLTANQLLYATGFNTAASVATSTLSASSPLTGSFVQIGTGGSLGIQAASASQAGSISANDYQRLYSATTTFSSPLLYTGSTNAVTITGGTNGQVLGWANGAAAFVSTSTCIQITGSAALCDGDDASGGGGGAWAFTPDSYNSVANNSTTTPLWLKNTMIIASSTLFTQASSSMTTLAGSTWFTGINGPAELAIDSTGKLYAAATTTAGNPSGSIGSASATNGTATTYMRSDAIPACTAATASVPGCLAAVDFATFAGKVNLSNLFDKTTDYGFAVLSTTTRLHFLNGMFASSTSVFVNATTSQLSVSSAIWLGGFTYGDIGTDATGKIIAVATSTQYGTGSNGQVLGWTNGIPAWVSTTSPTAANPTASVTLSAQNGSALTFMRSDAAPALDQSISPTMTGAWAFNGAASTTIANGFFAKTIAAQYFMATSTNATSLFQGAVTIATTTNQALNVNDQYGTNILRLSTASTTAGYDMLQLWSATSTGPLFAFDQYGHMAASSTAPVLSSCGTSPTITSDSSDFSGTITTGATASGCTLAFGTPHVNAPHCVITPQTGSVTNTFSYTESTTGFVVTQTGIGGGKVDYICTGK